MKAIEQTHRMLAWFERAGITAYDLGVLRSDATFISQHSCGLDRQGLERCLSWARFENASGAEVYLRPARGEDWPVAFLDDVSAPRARAIAARYGSLIVRTSGNQQGGCHVWLHVSRSLGEVGRNQVQRWLALRVGADPASTSGEHWGRLAGMKNHKRGGVWIGVAYVSLLPPWDPARVSAQPPAGSSSTAPLRRGTSPSRASDERDESVAEFAWCCHLVRRGAPHAWIVAALTARARARGKRHPEHYARRTLRAALARLHRGS